jgi:hypothetical protein
MKRKITKNNHQYKVSLPIEIVRKLDWDHNTSIKFHEVETPFGRGMLITKDNVDTAIKLGMRKRWH